MAQTVNITGDPLILFTSLCRMFILSSMIGSLLEDKNYPSFLLHEKPIVVDTFEQNRINECGEKDSTTKIGVLAL
jgi:hypothetical protein